MTDEPERIKLLNDASNIIAGNRDTQYGGPEDSFAQIAEHWTTYLTRRCGLAEKLQPGDVAAMMTLLKVARLETGGLVQRDTWLDSAGYAACGWEVSQKDKK